ncbi:MAG: hypothetical protein ACI8U0_001550 [Flavobacteriales bacterium]|jgi:hypothetical protein
MKTFDWTSFTRKIAVKTDLKTMYDAWTKSGNIEKWFLSNCDYKSGDENILKDQYAEAGMTYAWSWHLWDPTENGKVNIANGKDHFQFTFAGDCIVDVRLQEFNDHIIVAITQSNIAEDDKSKQDIRLGCDKGWSFYLVNLKSVYEGGLDLRNKNVEIKGMLNT